MGTTLVFHVFTTTWTPGVADTLGLEWDAAGDQFLFDVNPGTPGAESVALAYTVPDGFPPGFDQKRVDVSNFLANCTAGQKRASMAAAFDNVMLNPEAVGSDASAGVLAPSHPWRSGIRFRWNRRR